MLELEEIIVVVPKNEHSCQRRNNSTSRLIVLRVVYLIMRFLSLMFPEDDLSQKIEDLIKIDSIECGKKIN